MNLMEQFADPEIFRSMSMSEKLLGSGITALMGMGVTFLVLFFLWGCISLMARLMNRHPELPAATAESAAAKQVPVVVLAAAAMAAECEGERLVIRKIRRLSVKPAWSNAVTERRVSK